MKQETQSLKDNKLLFAANLEFFIFKRQKRAFEED